MFKSSRMLFTTNTEVIEGKIKKGWNGWGLCLKGKYASLYSVIKMQLTIAFQKGLSGMYFLRHKREIWK